MSLYMRYAQGAPEKTSFTLSSDNIEEYLTYATDMDRDVHWFNNIDDLSYKLKHPETVKDELYTPTYISRRLEKLREGKILTDSDIELLSIKDEIRYVNDEISKVRPLVFDLEHGKNPEHHERMSELDDKRKKLEDRIDSYYQSRYPKLYKDLSKIYYMIVEGVDIQTVISCFQQMKDVLTNKKSVESAAETLMNESITKYNLPQGIWDPIKTKKSSSSSSKSSSSKSSSSSGKRTTRQVRP